MDHILSVISWTHQVLASSLHPYRPGYHRYRVTAPMQPTHISDKQPTIYLSAKPGEICEAKPIDKKDVKLYEVLKNAVDEGNYLVFAYRVERLKWKSLPSIYLVELVYRIIKTWGHPVALRALMDSKSITEDILEETKKLATFHLKDKKDDEKDPVIGVIDILMKPTERHYWKQMEFAKLLYEAANLTDQEQIKRLAKDEMLDFSKDVTLKNMAAHALKTGNYFFNSLVSKNEPQKPE